MTSAGRTTSPFDEIKRLSWQLRDAALLLADQHPAMAEWVRDEAVHAQEAEHLAERTSDLAITSVQPVYRPSTLHARLVAQEVFDA